MARLAFGFGIIVLSFSAAFFLVVIVGALRGERDGIRAGGNVLTDSPTTMMSEPSAELTASPLPAAPPAPQDTILVDCRNVLAPVNEQHSCPPDFVPGDLVDVGSGQTLRSEAAAAFTEMLAAAQREGHILLVVSGFRSHETQTRIWGSSVASTGEEETARFSARPVHSEHQLGTAMAVSNRDLGGALEQAFGASKEGKWLAGNAPRFGFIVSYPPGKEAITGYSYEPWHIRYVGAAEAQRVVASGLTMHEYLLR